MKVFRKHRKSENRSVKELEERIFMAADSGRPIEIKGKAYYIQSDIQHLRTIMNS